MFSKHLITVEEDDVQYVYAFLNTSFDPPPVEEKDEPFTLFDSDEIKEYLDELDNCRLLSQEDKKKYFVPVESAYLELISDFPEYPDAYRGLAELYAYKDPERSIAYYEQYIKLMPYDLNAPAELALQRNALNKLFPGDPPYPNNDLLKALKVAREKKVKEMLFRKWYHIKMRKLLLPMKLPIIAPIMDPELDDNVDYANPGLSNDAVLEAYSAFEAKEAYDYKLANYYQKKAIIKFKHDFISITQYSATTYVDGFSEKAIEELSKCIDKYAYAHSYYSRYLIYVMLNRNEEAKADLIQSLIISDKSDLDYIHTSHRRAILAHLNNASYTTHPPTPSRLTSNELELIWSLLNASIAAINGNYYKRNYVEEIELVTGLLNVDPYNGKNYATRAFFYLNKGELELAKLDYSLAIMFSPEASIYDLYFGRVTANLISGDIVRVEYDLNNAIYLISHKKDRAQLNILLKTFANECEAKSKKHLENGNFAIAEKICVLGLKKWRSLDLYMRCAIARGLQENYFQALETLATLKNLHGLDKKTHASIDRYTRHFSEKLHKSLLPPKPDVSESKTQESYSVIEKKKKKHTKPRITLVTPQQPKRSTSSTVSIKSLLQVDPIAAEPEYEEESQELRETKERERIIKKNLRTKLKRARLRELRINKPNQSDDENDSSASDSDDSLEFQAELLTQLPPAEKEDLILELRDSEKMIFNLFAACKAQHPDKKFKTYIVGGWTYDRVREHLFGVAPPKKKSDFDLVTEIPIATLITQLPNFRVVPHVRGLLKGSIGGYEIDIIHRENLSVLSKDARSRDFLCLYMDEEGHIFDPIGFAIMYMKAGILKSAVLASEVFKRDPLTIIRAVYACTIRNLRMTDLKKQIKLDKHLLVPRIGTEDADTLYQPYRFNVLIKKNFSHGCALTNYDFMDELGLLEVLFPHIYIYLKKEDDWMRSQMLTTDRIEWPKLEIIYSNMIACAVMSQVEAQLDNCVNARLNEANIILGGMFSLNAEGIAAIKLHTESKLIEHFTDSIIKKSLLFSNLEKLPLFIQKSISEWKRFKDMKIKSAAKNSETASEPTQEMERLSLGPRP